MDVSESGQDLPFESGVFVGVKPPLQINIVQMQLRPRSLSRRNQPSLQHIFALSTTQTAGSQTQLFLS